MSRYISSQLLEETLGGASQQLITDTNIKINNITANPTDDVESPSSWNIADSENSSLPELRHWRGLGSYLDTLRTANVQHGGEPGDDNSTVFANSTRPLSHPLNYRICNDCGTAVLVSCFIEHLEKCAKSEGKSKNGNGVNVGNGNGNGAVNGHLTNVHHIEGETSSSTEAPQPASGKKKDSKAKSSPKKKMTKKRKLEEEEEIIPATTTKKVSIGTKLEKTNNNNGDDDKGDGCKKKTDISTADPEGDSKQKANNKNRNKGPVDVERQCGVPLPKGGFCARSLTCKTHSMGAKRAVLGRSAPYDQLLAAYQRKNQAKIGAAAAAAQQAKDDLIHSAAVALDDEEETQQVLAGVRRSSAMPLERNVCVPVRMRTKYLRMREMFATNLLPRLQSNPLGKMYARAVVMNVEHIGETSYFPVRSQHQKNNQQRQAMKQNQVAVQMQMQKHAQAQAQAQARAQSQFQSQAQGQMQSQLHAQAQSSGINLAAMNPQQQKQYLMKQNALNGMPGS